MKGNQQYGAHIRPNMFNNWMMETRDETLAKTCVYVGRSMQQSHVGYAQGRSHDFDLGGGGVDLRIWKYPMYILFSNFNRWLNLIIQ